MMGALQVMPTNIFSILRISQLHETLSARNSEEMLVSVTGLLKCDSSVFAIIILQYFMQYVTFGIMTGMNS